MTSAREAELSRQLQERDEQLARVSKQLEELVRENALLREKIDLLVRKLFGTKSEQLDPAQLLLLLQGLDEPGKAPEPVAVEAPPRRRRGIGRLVVGRAALDGPIASA